MTFSCESLFLPCPVQPDSPKIVNCQEVEQGLQVSISPPATWSTPHSFYSLENQIQYMLKDNGEVKASRTPQPWMIILRFFYVIIQRLLTDMPVLCLLQLQLSSSAVIPRGVSRLRVRSRDDLAMSAWSKWTPWKNVTN